MNINLLKLLLSVSLKPYWFQSNKSKSLKLVYVFILIFILFNIKLTSKKMIKKNKYIKIAYNL